MVSQAERIADDRSCSIQSPGSGVNSLCSSHSSRQESGRITLTEANLQVSSHIIGGLAGVGARPVREQNALTGAPAAVPAGCLLLSAGLASNTRLGLWIGRVIRDNKC